jgi:Holliday junction DNA helicase RuvB
MEANETDVVTPSDTDQEKINAADEVVENELTDGHVPHDTKPSSSMGDGITNATRPDSLDDVVGMATAIRKVKLTVLGSQHRNQPPRSLLVTGPSGCGKTTLAKIVNKLLNRPGRPSKLYNIPASDISSLDDLYALASSGVKDNDVIFFEEAHTIGGGGKKAKLIQAALYEWIEDFRLSGMVTQQGMTIAPKVCFIFATTDPGKLLEPLRNRCERIDLQYYSVDEIKIILQRAAVKLGMETPLDEEALDLLAKSCRGIPRVAIMQRLNPIIDMMAVENREFNVGTVEALFELQELHPLGLEANDILYCNQLYTSMKSNGGKPVGSKTLQMMTGLTDNLIENLIEPYLIKSGIVLISSRGRLITDYGYDVLNLKPITTPGTIQHVRVNGPSMDMIDDLLKDQEVIRQGVQSFMAKLGLDYSNITERAAFKAALFDRGYEVKRRAGIVKITSSSLGTGTIPRLSQLT